MLSLKKTGLAVAAAAVLATATLPTPQPAAAHGSGGAVAAGIIGGIAAGALVGAAVAGPHYYGPGYYYGPAPVYYGPNCWWQRERFWDGYGWRLRRVRVCNLPNVFAMRAGALKRRPPHARFIPKHVRPDAERSSERSRIHRSLTVRGQSFYQTRGRGAAGENL
jgi:hypothetical protein